MNLPSPPRPEPASVHIIYARAGIRTCIMHITRPATHYTFCLCLCLSLCLSMSLSVCLSVCLSLSHTHTHTHTHSRTHARTHTHTRERARTYARTHARTHAHTHTPIPTPTHSNLRAIGLEKRFWEGESCLKEDLKGLSNYINNHSLLRLLSAARAVELNLISSQ